MKELWNKNKYTIIALLNYAILTPIFCNITTFHFAVYILSLIALPMIYNFKIDSIWSIKNKGSKPLLFILSAGFIFGFMLIPYDTTFLFGKFYTLIANIFTLKWNLINLKMISGIIFVYLIAIFNICINGHRDSYRRRNYDKDLAQIRDEKLNDLLNSSYSKIKKQFYQTQ